MIYTTNDTCIMSATRCGHTSMMEWFDIDKEYIGLEEKQDLYWFTDSPAKQLVVVLRNPYDRLLSAIKNTKLLRDEQLAITPESEKYKFRFTLPRYSHDHIVLHSNLYLDILASLASRRYLRSFPSKFKHIDFYRLNEYIPVSKNLRTVTTNSKSDGWDYRMSEFYSKEDMQKEYNAYINLLDNTEELSVADWIKVNPLHGIKVNKYIRPQNQFPATKKAGD
mgnify:CR=1 FL=1|tara:strand:- start:693 stop:1358 length:666 start_codon:yes stop_codon:yes gene_type:complete